MLIKAYAVPYLLTVDPHDENGRTEIDVMIEMVRAWARSPKPKLAKRAATLLVRLEAVRDADLKITVVPTGKPDRMLDRFLARCIEISKASKNPKWGLNRSHIEALEVFVGCIVA